MNRVVNYSLARTRTLAWWNALPSRVRTVLTVLFTLAIVGGWVGWLLLLSTPTPEQRLAAEANEVQSLASDWVAENFGTATGDPTCTVEETQHHCTFTVQVVDTDVTLGGVYSSGDNEEDTRRPATLSCRTVTGGDLQCDLYTPRTN